MGSTEADVAIIGAGPAGCAAALQLARNGVRVTLIDKSRFPRDKVCGDGIGPRALRVLEQLGAFSRDRFSKFQQLEGVLLSSPGGHTIKVRLKDDPEVGPGYVIPRVTFDKILLEEALNTGISFMESFQVQEIVSLGHAVEVVGSHLGNSRRLRAELVVVACGSRTPRGVPRGCAPSDGRHSALAVRAYFEGIKGIEPYMAIHFDPDLVPGYAWVFPTGTGSANIGYGMRADHLMRAKAPLRVLYHQFVLTNRFVKDSLREATQTSPLRGAVIPFRRWRDPIVGDRMLLAGDAGGFADPLTGEGIGNALLTGMLSAQYSAQALERGDLSRKGLSGYERRCRRLLGKDLFCGALLQGLLVSPRVTSPQKMIDAFIHKASNNERMARAMARLVIGDLPRDVVLRGEMWRKLWRAWRDS